MPEQVDTIKLTDIREPRHILRPVDKASLEFIQLRDSLKVNGFITPVTVMRHPEGGYELLCGWWRINAAKANDYLYVPALIRDYVEDDNQYKVLQIIENLVRKETTKLEHAVYLKALQQFLDIDAIAAQLHQSRSWIYRQLDLLNLRPELHQLINERKMPLANAYYLARLPLDMQAEHFQQACDMPTKTFEKFVTTIRSAKKLVIEKQMSMEWAKQYVTKRRRTANSLRKEVKKPNKLIKLLAMANPKNTLDAMKLGVQFALGEDAYSLKEVQDREQKAFEKRNKMA